MADNVINRLNNLEQKVDKLAENDKYTQVMFEKIDGQYQAIAEGIDELLTIKPKVDKMEKDIEQIKVDVDALKLGAHVH